MNNTVPSQFRTTELPFAAALITKGFTFLGAEGADPRRLDFVFVWDERIEDLRKEYHEGTLEANVISLANSFRILKGIIKLRREQG